MNQERVEQLTQKILEPIKANYEDLPLSRDRVHEALNALAIAVAYVLEGANDSEADRFFNGAVERQRKIISES